MAILEKEVYITLQGKNIPHFKQLGYEIPRVKDINNELRVKQGTKILVKIEDISINSSVKVTKICDVCGENTPNQQYHNIIRNRENGDGLDRCYNCKRIYAGNSKRNNVKYNKSLEWFANENDMKFLLLEFSNKNNKKPNQISYGTSDEYLWICPDCGSEYPMKVQIRTKKKCGCSYCSGKKVNNTNCLSTLYPELATEWHPTKNGNLTPESVTKGKKGKVWWLCPECNYSYPSTINDRRNGCGCPRCNQSKGEKRINKWLGFNNIEFIPQMEFEGLIGLGRGNLSYDFYLPNINLLIEYQGQFHDGSNGEYTKLNLKNQQEHDRRKREYALKNNIDLLEIWYWDFNRVESILEMKLKEELHEQN
jgi:protein-arginine kinase activator protein McsA